MRIRWPFLIVLVGLAILLILDLAGFERWGKSGNTTFSRVTLLSEQPINSAEDDLPDKPPPVVLEVGFGEADITPVLGEKPVFMAGFGHGREATKIHDPLLARAVVF